jgi:dethiobiotin synthetase
MRAGLFVAGTDTGVGKTRVTSLLVSGLRRLGKDAVGLKPFACGDRGDAESLWAANEGVLDMDVINPVWLRPPTAPFAASLIEERVVDVALAREGVRQVQSRHSFVVVEGVGGWRVPLTESVCASDFAVELGLPVVVVIANRLGALNHAQLTVESIRRRGLSVVALVWNEVLPPAEDPARWTNRAVLEHWCPEPWVGEVPFGAESLPDAMLQALWERGLGGPGS